MVGPPGTEIGSAVAIETDDTLLSTIAVLHRRKR